MHFRWSVLKGHAFQARTWHGCRGWGQLGWPQSRLGPEGPALRWTEPSEESFVRPVPLS